MGRRKAVLAGSLGAGSVRGREEWRMKALNSGSGF